MTFAQPQGTVALVSPSPEWEVEVRDYKQEHLAPGETELHGGVLPGQLPYPEWLALMERNAVFEAVSPDWRVFHLFCSAAFGSPADWNGKHPVHLK